MARTEADIARMKAKGNIRGLTKALKDDEFWMRKVKWRSSLLER